MKIAVLTFWQTKNNYGQILQMFALQKKLVQLGHEPYVIKYAYNASNLPKSVWKLVKKLFSTPYSEFTSRLIYMSQVIRENLVDPRGFDDFKNSFINFSDTYYSTPQELFQNPPQAEAYIVGSDQVWNDTFGIPIEPYLLPFVSQYKRKISYAASFGVTNLKKENWPLFKKQLRTFHRISVREGQGVEICRQLGIQEASQVLDPTLLFTKDEWLSYFNLSPKSTPSAGCFMYTLSNSPLKNNTELLEDVYSLFGDKVVHVSANGGYSGKHFLTIPAWVEGISEASFVVTNSFHGLAFALIFNKPFLMLPNTQKAEGMNERVKSLFSLLKLPDSLLSDYQPGTISKVVRTSNFINWEEVNSELEKHRQISIDFLLNALGNH